MAARARFKAHGAASVWRQKNRVFLRSNPQICRINIARYFSRICGEYFHNKSGGATAARAGQGSLRKPRCPASSACLLRKRATLRPWRWRPSGRTSRIWPWAATGLSARSSRRDGRPEHLRRSVALGAIGRLGCDLARHPATRAAGTGCWNCWRGKTRPLDVDGIAMPASTGPQRRHFII